MIIMIMVIMIVMMIIVIMMNMVIEQPNITEVKVVIVIIIISGQIHDCSPKSKCDDRIGPKHLPVDKPGIEIVNFQKIRKGRKNKC